MSRISSKVSIASIFCILSLANSLSAQTLPEVTAVEITDRVPLLHVGVYDFNMPDHNEMKYMHSLLKAVETQSANAMRHADSLFGDLKRAKRDKGQYAALRWLSEVLAAGPQDRATYLADDYQRSYYDFFMGDKCAMLIEYIRRIYNIEPSGISDPLTTQRRATMLIEFVMGLNPVRLRPALRREIIEALDIRPGSRIADVGAAPGHFTFAMAKRAGTTGHVYAHIYDSKFMPNHVDCMRKAIASVKPGNVTLIEGDRNDIGGTNKVDIVLLNFCYSSMYIALTETERQGVFASIRRALKPGGLLAIVDNSRPSTNPPSSHLCYVDADLTAGQVSQYGYRLLRRQTFPPGIHVLVFADDRAPDFTPAAKADLRFTPPNHLKINAKHSLLRYPIMELAPRSAEYTVAAKTLLDAMDTGDTAKARSAYDQFKKISAEDMIGGDYTAMQWFSEYFSADRDRRAEMLRNRFDRSYFNYFTANTNLYLKLILKFNFCSDIQNSNVEVPSVIPAGIPFDEFLGTLYDSILCNNPFRESWEKTSSIVECLKLQPGEKVADVGSGPGYYSFKFADLVGSNGMIYAIDLNESHLKYVDVLCREHGINNIRTIKSTESDICVSDKVDVVFLCSLFHAVYLCGKEQGITSFIDSISRALKDEGRLVIADNAIVDDDITPYHGPLISKELVMAYLHQYGYDLVEQHHFTPQRYVLIFKKTPRQSSAGRSGTSRP